MRKMFSVLHYEYKMPFKRLVTWGILLVATTLSLLDNFPSAGNLARLEFLNEPAYFVYRIVSLDSLVLLFGLMFLLAGRIPIDTKTGMKSLLMSSTLRKWQYVLRKLLGGFLYVFSSEISLRYGKPSVGRGMRFPHAPPCKDSRVRFLLSCLVPPHLQPSGLSAPHPNR